MTQITNQLKNIFPQLKNCKCLEENSSSEFKIVEDEISKRSVICSVGEFLELERDDQNKKTLQVFHIHNPQEKEISFLAVDSCLFTSSDEERCDFIVFDNQYFCFVELKRVKFKQESKKRLKAAKQLESTITLFQDKLDLINHIQEAYLAVGFLGKPKKRADINNMRVKFKEKLGVLLHLEFKKSF